MADSHREDFFSVADRKELINQGLVLDRLVRDFEQLKNKLLEEHEIRLRSLEDDRIKLGTSVKTILWVGGLMVTLVQVGVEVAIHLWLK